MSANDSWFTGTGGADPNHKLMDGIVKATSSMAATLTLSNLVPGGTYTLIAYTIENGTGGAGVGAQSNNTLTVGNTKYYTTAPVDFNGTFIRAMNTNPAGPRDVGNYVEFDNVIADANGRIVLTDTFDGPSPQQDGTGIAAIQLQGPAPIPEPASAALVCFGAAVLIGMARWRRTP